MEHSFDVEIAKEYGVNYAVVLNQLIQLYEHDKTQKENYREGRCWSEYTEKELCKMFPYLSLREIQSELHNLARNHKIELYMIVDRIYFHVL